MADGDDGSDGSEPCASIWKLTRSVNVCPGAISGMVAGIVRVVVRVAVMVIVPVAGLPAAAGSVYWKTVALITVTVNVPLYAACVAPAMVTRSPVAMLCAVVVVAVASVATLNSV